MLELPDRRSVVVAADWPGDSTLDHQGQTLDRFAGPSLLAMKRKHTINIFYCISHNQYFIKVQGCWHISIQFSLPPWTRILCISLVQTQSVNFNPRNLSSRALSPCWSGLGGACSRWCRGRGICWFVRRPVGLELPAPGRWTPAVRGAARWGDRLWARLAATPPHPALLLPVSRTHAGRKPGGQSQKRDCFVKLHSKLLIGKVIKIVKIVQNSITFSFFYVAKFKVWIHIKWKQ